MFVCKILTLTTLIVLQNIRAMPQSGSAAGAEACATIRCRKNQTCSYNKSTERASCVCKEGFIKDTNESGGRKCKPKEENQTPLQKTMSAIEKNPCLINTCGRNEKCVVTNGLRDEFRCECEDGFIKSNAGFSGCIQLPTDPDLDFEVEKQSDTFALTPQLFLEFAGSINDFTQDFMRELWEEGDNVVFSPFSLHSVLAILISGVTPGSTTERELLRALGRVNNVQRLEASYERMIDNYKVELASGKWELAIGNRLWTTKNNFEKMNSGYMEKISGIYEAGFEQLEDKNPEVAINNWVEKITKGKIDKIVGNFTLWP